MAIAPEPGLNSVPDSDSSMHGWHHPGDPDSSESALAEPTKLLEEDRTEIGTGALVIQSIAIFIFALQLAFTIYNAVKFYRHRSYALGLFYVLAIVNFVVRMMYYVQNFFATDSYWNVVFLCYPASFSCAIGVCQIMNYSVLYIRLDSYAKHRAKKGDQIAEEDLERTTNKEYITTGVFTMIIFAFPIVISLLLLFQRKTFDGDVIARWEKY